MANTKGSGIAKLVVFLAAVVMALIGYFVYGVINDKIFAGVYPFGKIPALTAGFIPLMIADFVKNKKIVNLIFPMILFIGIFVWFYLSLPVMTYDKATDSLDGKYEAIQTAVSTFDDDDITKEKIPGYYKGAYLFKATRDGVEYYVVMNPKNGETYEYEVSKNEKMAHFFEDDK